jgi:hypothetical protein
VVQIARLRVQAVTVALELAASEPAVEPRQVDRDLEAARVALERLVSIATLVRLALRGPRVPVVPIATLVRLVSIARRGQRARRVTLVQRALDAPLRPVVMTHRRPAAGEWSPERARGSSVRTPPIPR